MATLQKQTVATGKAGRVSAQDCYMIVDGLAQETLILLFSKAIYLNVGYGFLVHCSRYLLSVSGV